MKGVCMKKLLLIILLNFFIVQVSYAVCKIDSLDACKADIGTGINDKLQDKIIPNNIEQLKRPNNTLNNRTKLGQPNLPENINQQPIQTEDTQPYDANCQFGNCFDRTNAGGQKN
jgi:hypothetical protein